MGAVMVTLSLLAITLLVCVRYRKLTLLPSPLTVDTVDTVDSEHGSTNSYSSAHRLIYTYHYPGQAKEVLTGNHGKGDSDPGQHYASSPVVRGDYNPSARGIYSPIVREDYSQVARGDYSHVARGDYRPMARGDYSKPYSYVVVPGPPGSMLA